MKLSFECFEEIASLSIRGAVEEQELKILQLGILTLLKELSTPLILNLTHAEVGAKLTHTLFTFKKGLPALTHHEVIWLCRIPGVADFPNLEAFAQKSKGSKSRQVFDRLRTEEQVYDLQLKRNDLEQKIEATSVEAINQEALLLKNRALNEEIRILRESNRFLRERQKLQSPVPTENETYGEELSQVMQALKTQYGIENKP